MLETVPGNDQYLAIRTKYIAQGNGGLGLGSNTRPPHYELDVHPTAPRRPLYLFDKVLMCFAIICSMNSAMFSERQFKEHVNDVSII